MLLARGQRERAGRELGRGLRGCAGAVLAARAVAVGRGDERFADLEADHAAAAAAGEGDGGRHGHARSLRGRHGGAVTVTSGRDAFRRRAEGRVTRVESPLMRLPWFSSSRSTRLLRHRSVASPGYVRHHSAGHRRLGRADGRGPPAWCRILQDVEWTSARPFGVGTTRTVRSLGGTNVMNERFSAGRRGGESRSTSSRRPPRCSRVSRRTIWWSRRRTRRADFAGPSRPTSATGAARKSVNKPLLGSLFRDTARHYALD